MCIRDRCVAPYVEGISALTSTSGLNFIVCTYGDDLSIGISSRFLGQKAVSYTHLRNVSVVSDILSAASVALLPIVDMIWGLSFGWFVALGLLGAVGDIDVYKRQGPGRAFTETGGEQGREPHALTHDGFQLVGIEAEQIASR